MLFKTLSRQKTLTPVEALAKAGLISDAIVSYKLARVRDNNNDGDITFGCVRRALPILSPPTSNL
jgi:hypothetical protein